MPTLGRILREQREKQGLSLDDIVKRTRISRKSLEALENDDPAETGSVFYYRSFARHVAGLLNLDTPEWREALSASERIELPPPPPPAPESYTPRVAPIRQRRQSRWRALSPVVSFVVVLTACSGIYAILNQFDISELTPVQQAAASLSNEASASFSKAMARLSFSGTQKQPPSVVAEGALPTRPAQPILHRPDANGEAILLKIAAVEKTWLSVDTDGRHIYSGLLDPADTKELEGRDTAKIRTGNAGGLTVTFNGRDLGPLGQRGQVRTIVFTRDRYRIVAPDLTSRLALFPAVALPKLGL
jgi:cytoskeleton protein RodZ